MNIECGAELGWRSTSPDGHNVVKVGADGLACTHIQIKPIESYIPSTVICRNISYLIKLDWRVFLRDDDRISRNCFPLNWGRPIMSRNVINGFNCRRWVSA